MLQNIGVANGSLAKQFLEFPTVVERPLHIGHEVIGDIDGQSPSLQPDVEEMARVPFPLQTGLAVLANAGTPAQAERAQSCRPKSRGLALEPLLDIRGGFFWSTHEVRIPHGLRTVKVFRSIIVNAITYEFRDRNYLRQSSFAASSLSGSWYSSQTAADMFDNNRQHPD